VQYFISDCSKFRVDTLTYRQPVELDQCWCDMVEKAVNREACREKSTCLSIHCHIHMSHQHSLHVHYTAMDTVHQCRCHQLPSQLLLLLLMMMMLLQVDLLPLVEISQFIEITGLTSVQYFMSGCYDIQC